MSGLLFNKVPDAYMSVKNNVINTCFNPTKNAGKNFKPRKSKKRHTFFYEENGEYKMASTVFQRQDIRIINVGKYHVDFQIESLKTQEFGMLRSAKLFTDKRGKYFEWKNNKYFISKRHVVL